MNIVDFLIANYHWILAIILLTIITIIGFLADKKKNNKKKDNNKEKESQSNNKITIKQQPMQYQPEIKNQIDTQQNMMPNDVNGINNGTMNQNPNINQIGLMEQINNNQGIGTIPQPMTSNMVMPNNNNLINNLQPVENIVPEEIQEPMYQSLEEQQPHFTAKPIPSFEAIKEAQNQSPQMINNPQSVVNQNVMNPQPMMQVVPQPMMQQSQQQMQSPETIGPMPNYNQNTNMQGNNNYGMPNMIPNQVTIPQPVNPIPVPQPVMPQQIVTNQMQNQEPMGPMPTYNMNQQVSNLNGFVGNQNMQQPPMIQQTQQPMQMPNSPINFVYGPQNNNQNI